MSFYARMSIHSISILNPLYQTWQQPLLLQWTEVRIMENLFKKWEDGLIIEEFLWAKGIALHI